ncbi:organic cation/carnitine transporter 4-like [Impatiens glandulifera]|uniref:organic cation/carnitine transporter 4-like n=1 Tax=Impatiens glandulifera TaxID=253017 RepID=UPI001FB0A65C|nr:organic cation/carnitine transporter 4-like [Impatiens glandulifera]
MTTLYSPTTDADLSTPLISPAHKNSDDIERLCIDDMLRKYCGEFGRWQFRHFILTSLAWALEAFHTMVMIFADREPEWRCTAAAGGCAAGLCGLKTGSWEWIEGMGSSTVEEWGLICGEKYKVGIVQSIFFVGSMIGAGIFGHLSDSFMGRKGSLTIVCILNALFGCLTALAPDYFTYVLLRFLTGFSTGGVGLCAFVLATEPVGPSKRGKAGMSTFYFFSSGIAILSGLAYLFPTWRILYFVTSIPSLLFLVLVLPFVSESPRWYLIRGKHDHAMNIMRNIAKSNGKHLPEGVVLAVDEDKRNRGNETKDGALTGSLMDVIRTPMTRLRLFLSVAINLLCSVVYYGLSLNVVNLGTNLYTSVFLNAVAEMPAFLLTALLLDRFGRKPLAIGTQWFSGLFCLLGSLVVGLYGELKWARLACGIMGIFGMAGTYNLLFIYTVELFPTVVRNAALGCATQAAQMGAILTPYVVVMGGWLPFAVFAGCGLVSGMLAFWLPETMDRPLYDTMEGLKEGEKVQNIVVIV